MDPDSYLVEILHYLNPHLIWVEVSKPNSTKVKFEQIGIYGILPLELSIDKLNNCVTSKISPVWAPVVAKEMSQAFSNSVQIFFSTTHIDRRTSIFDNNIHKYGELYIKTQNGDIKKLSKLLLRTGFVCKNESEFLNKLSSFQLKTNLDNLETAGVIKILENVCLNKSQEDSIKKNTSVFKAGQNFESALTQENLKHLNIAKIVEKKQRLLEICKDTEEKSVGRGVTSKNSSLNSEETPKYNSFIAKRLSLAKKKEANSQENSMTKEEHFKENDPFIIMDNLKRLVLSEAYVKGKDNTTNGRKSVQITEEENVQNEQCLQLHKDLDHILFNSHSKQNAGNQSLNDCNSAHLNNEDLQSTKQEQEGVQSFANDFDDVDTIHSKLDSILLKNQCQPQTFDDFNSGLVTKRKAARKHAVKIQLPEYDSKTQKLVAFGPPDTDQSKLGLKVVSKELYISSDVATRNEDGQNDDTPAEHQFEAGIDSRIYYSKTNTRNDDDESNYSTEEHKFEPGMHSKVDNSKTYNDITTKSKIEKTELSKDQPPLYCSTPSKVSTDASIERSQNSDNAGNTLTSNRLIRLLQKKKIYAKIYHDLSTSSNHAPADISSSSDSAMKSNLNVSNSNDEKMSLVLKELDLEYPTEPKTVLKDVEKRMSNVPHHENHVNPFKNIDANFSKFVEKLIFPVLMVHSKLNNRVQPRQLADVCFNKNIHTALRQMSVKEAKTLQTVTWHSILRGDSIFMISPKDGGKTLGYTPAVCQQVHDFDATECYGVGPICIIVCATAKSASVVERQCKTFLGQDNKVVSCYPGVDELHITTSLLNGCDILIGTPTALVRLMERPKFPVDMRRLTTFVLDDCERLVEVYKKEVDFFLLKTKEMLKTRANEYHLVQFVVASRIWCDFMEPLAKFAPDTVVCIGSFQECILYSKNEMSISFLKAENKLNAVVEFVEAVKGSEKTVIVCRENAEIELIKDALHKKQYVVYIADNNMTVHDLYKLSSAWASYSDPVQGPILICSDGSLLHLNITDARNLLHYSLPSKFSQFCKRFAVLTEHYPSIFKDQAENVKIKILLDSDNTEQIPKIMNFTKRCTDNVPAALNERCANVLTEKDVTKAENLIPLCSDMLAFGQCTDFWNCPGRHTVLKKYDKPLEWVPKTGIVTFRIIHYFTPVAYSVRLLSIVNNGTTQKLLQNYIGLAMKMGLYFGNEKNRRLHGVPKVGDICAVLITESKFERCQVTNIGANYEKTGNLNNILVKLIDEEEWVRTKDVNLYHLPDEFRNVETYTMQVRLAKVQPKDKDVTFSELAKQHLKKLIDGQDTIYFRAKVAMAIGNTLIVESLEACQDLQRFGKTVIMYDVRDELMQRHATDNPGHILQLQKWCEKSGITKSETQLNEELDEKNIGVEESTQELPEPSWAHLEDDTQMVYYGSAESPGNFFIRLVKFDNCLEGLKEDIQKYVSDTNCKPVTTVIEKDIVLAKFPDDSLFYRARIDEVLSENKVKCFFVDYGDWREVQNKDLILIPEHFILSIPFQAIECRLVGVQPISEEWNQYSINWFCSQFYVGSDDLKELNVKFFTKETAESTEGHKYGIVLVDSTTEQVIVLNLAMLDLNLAAECDNEIDFLYENGFRARELLDTEAEWEKEGERYQKYKQSKKMDGYVDNRNLNKFLGAPLRSVPLVGSDDSSDDFDCFFDQDDLKPILGSMSLPQVPSNLSATNTLLALAEAPHEKNVNELTDSKVSEYEIIPSPKNEIQLLDSDDFSSSECTVLSEKSCEKPSTASNTLSALSDQQLNENEKERTESKVSEYEIVPSSKCEMQSLDSDDVLSSECTVLSEKSSENRPNSEESLLRKPKLNWYQNKNIVFIKVLIGVEKYNIEIMERSVELCANANDTEYGFNIKLYGTVVPQKSTHASKGLSILIKLEKIIKRDWITLTKDAGNKKWITYDPDQIDALSEAEDEIDMLREKEAHKKMIEQAHYNADSCDSDDGYDGPQDDVNFVGKYARTDLLNE